MAQDHLSVEMTSLWAIPLQCQHGRYIMEAFQEQQISLFNFFTSIVAGFTSKW